MAQKTQNTTTKQESLFTQIAQQHLDIETLADESFDAIDFHESVMDNVNIALKAAYNAGVASVIKHNHAA